MSTRQDPLTDAQVRTTDRLNYATGLMLAADDFVAEQSYHRGRLARVLTYLHGYGTVAGLRVTLSDPAAPPPEELRIDPGLAVDLLGRAIEVPRAVCIRLDEWLDDRDDDDLRQAFHTGVPVPDGSTVDGVVADVILSFVVCEHGKTPAFAAGPFDALDAIQANRLRDYFRADLVLRHGAPLPLFPQRWRAQLTAALGAGVVDPLTELSLDARRTALQTTILGAWDVTDADEIQADALGVPLARVVIPADDVAPRPQRTGPPHVDNFVRPFVYPAGAVAELLNW